MKTLNWKYFKIKDIFSDISIGKSYDLNTLDIEPNGIPYVGRGTTNNGHETRVNPNGLLITKGNCITVVMVGTPATSFYQKEDFVCSQNILVLRHPALNIYNAMFLCTIIEKETYRFSYGKTLTKGYFTEHKIKLPCYNDMPDWNKMEDFIKEHVVESLPAKARCVWNGDYDISPVLHEKIILSVDSWHWFKYDEVFDIRHGFYNKKPDDNPLGDIPFVGATDSNNGVTSHSDLDTIENTTKTGDGNNAPLSEKIFENCIAVTNNGSVGYAYYQEKPFTCTHDVNPLYIKKKYGIEMNKYIAMFLCTLIEKERFRWAYGRKWRPKRMPSSMIKLPAIQNADGTYTPDWQFMEDYIKSLPYSKNI